MPAHAFDHRQHRGAIVEHAGLYRRDFEISRDGIDLLPHELGRHGQDGGYAARVLRRQRR